MSGAELRAYVESGKPVFVEPNYDGWSWEISWTDKDHLLKLAELLEAQENDHDCGKYDLSVRTCKDHQLAVEYNKEGHLLILVTLD